jgi:uncharacterized protein involved in outer membrane biogenesis
MAFLQSKAARWLAGVIALCAAGWFALPYLIDVNQYRGLIQNQLRSKLGREVTLGPMELSVMPLSIKIRDFSIGEDPSIPGVTKPFASGKELRVSLGLFALLSKRIEVSSLSLTQPHIEIIRKKDGKLSVASLGNSNSSQAGSSGDQSIDRLIIDDGAVAITDMSVPGKPDREEYDHIDLDLRNFAPGREFQLDVTARLTEVTARDISAVVKAAMTGRSTDSELSAKGKLEATDISIRKSKLSFPLTANFDVKHQAAQKATQIQSLDLAVGATKFSISGSMLDQAAKLKIGTTKSSIDELLKLYAALGAGADPGMQASGLLTANVTADGPIEKPVLNGNLEATGLEIRNSAWKQPVKIADLKLTFTPAEIRSTPFQIEAGGTKLTGNFTMANYSTNASTIDASIKADNASVPELLSMAQAFGAAAPGVTGSGLVDLDVRVKGSTKKPDFAGKGRIENAQLNLPGISKPVAIPKLDARFEEDGVWIDQMNANLAGSKLQGTLSVQDFDSPRIKFALDIDKWNNTEMQKLFSDGSAKNPKAASRAPKQSLMSKATGNGTLRIGSLVINDIVLNQLSATAVLDHEILTMDPVKAELFGGGITGRIVADLRRDDAEINVRAKVDQVDANRLVSAMTPLKQTLFGRFGADTDLKLTANDNPAKSLNGTLSLRLADGKVMGVNMLNEVSKFAKFFGWNAPQTSFTDFVKMGGTLNIVNGVAQTNDFAMETNGAKFTGAGSFNLVAQTLDLKLITLLDGELSKRVGGSQIGGFMSTALADDKGQLMIPALVRGSFAKPSVTPDAENFAKLKVKSFIQPSGIKQVQGVIDLFRKKKPDQKQ